MENQFNATKETYRFAYFVFGSCFAFLVGYMILDSFGKLSQSSSDIKIAVMGFAGTAVGFIIGSSGGSRKKDDIISEATKPEQQTIKTGNVQTINVADKTEGTV